MDAEHLIAYGTTIAIVVWRLATYASRISVLEHEVKRLRNWRHRTANNLQALYNATPTRVASLEEIDFEKDDPPTGVKEIPRR